MTYIRTTYSPTNTSQNLVSTFFSSEEKTCSGEYRFGFQGQEAENELYGEGNASFFKYRISDNRLGRFFSIDPLAAKYPHNSPYAFSENRVIDGVELEGLEVEVINQTTYTDEINNTTYTFENFDVNYDLPQSNNIILNQIDYTTGLSNTSVLEPAVITPKPSQIQQANNKTDANNAITLNKNKPITPTKSSNICYDCSRFENGGYESKADKWVSDNIGQPVGNIIYDFATSEANAIYSMNWWSETDLSGNKLTLTQRTLNIGFGVLPFAKPFERISKTGKLGTHFDGKLIDFTIDKGEKMYKIGDEFINEDKK